MVCPKCGFSQPDDYYCANCGVNIDRYVQKKKKRGRAFGVGIVLLGILAIAVIRYVQTSHRTEEAKTVGGTGYEKSGPASKQTARTESGIQRTRSAQRSPRRGATRRPTTQAGPTSSKSAENGRSGSGVPVAPPQKAEEEVQSEQKETQFTAVQWFEKGRALDDDSELETESYRKAIQLDPKFAPAYYHLGAIYYRRADYELAAAEFAKFLQYASDVERVEYDIYRYYTDDELEGLLERGKPPSPTQEAAGPKSVSEEAGEAVPEGVAEEPEEAGPESAAEEAGEAAPETVVEGAEEAGPESSVENEQEVQTIIRFTSHNGQIWLPVVLNGSVTANVLLDTGSGMTIISTELAREIGLKVARDRTIRLRTIASEVQAGLARLDSIELGGLRRDNFPVAVSGLKLGEERRFDGILGMDFLNNYAIHIDNQNSRILLSPGSR